MNYGERIKQLLDEKNLNQNDLANALKVHPMTVSRWVNKAHLTTEEIEKICSFFKIEPWEFFYDNEKKAKELGVSTRALEIIRLVESLGEDYQDKLLDGFAQQLKLILSALEKSKNP